MVLLKIIYILVFIIFGLVTYAVMQIKLAGMNVKDFWSFVEANQTLDKLYEFSQKYKTLNKQQQVVYLMEAEKVFTAFDKIPDIIWEDEFKKYATKHTAKLTRARDETKGHILDSRIRAQGGKSTGPDAHIIAIKENHDDANGYDAVHEPVELTLSYNFTYIYFSSHFPS